MKDLNGNLKTVVDELTHHKIELQETREEREKLKSMVEQLNTENKVSGMSLMNFQTVMAN